MRHPSELKTPDHTKLNLNQARNFGPFFAFYLKLLRKNLSQVDDIGTSGRRCGTITAVKIITDVIRYRNPMQFHMLKFFFFNSDIRLTPFSRLRNLYRNKISVRSQNKLFQVLNYNTSLNSLVSYQFRIDEKKKK